MYFTLKYLCPPEYLPVVAWLDGELSAGWSLPSGNQMACFNMRQTELGFISYMILILEQAG